MDSLNCDVFDSELIRLCEEIEHDQELYELGEFISQLHRQVSHQVGRGMKRSATSPCTEVPEKKICPSNSRGVSTLSNEEPCSDVDILATFASSLLCLSAGLTNGITAVLLPQLFQDDAFRWAGAWIAASAPISSILGCMFIGMLLDGLGRRTVHVILAFPFVVGWMTMAFAQNFSTMLLGRFITGLSYGAVRPSTIIYLSEISDPKYRGIILLCPSLAVNSGVLLSHIIGTLFFWRIALLICIIPSLLLLVILYFIKESPYWLIAKGRVDEGIDSYRWFRGRSDAAENELQNVVEKHKGKTSQCNIRELFAIIFSRGFLKPTVTVVFIFLTVQMCGINVFPFYAYDLLRSLFHDTYIDTFLLIMVIDLLRVAISFVICCFGKKMRRKLTFVSAAYGTGLVLFGLVICCVYRGSPAIPLTFIVLYTCLASVVASLGWTFVAELYSTKVRGIGSGLSGAICFTILAVCVKITPDLLFYHESIMYGTFTAITVICAGVLSFILPETNGKRLQDIEDSYNQKHKDIRITSL